VTLLAGAVFSAFRLLGLPAVQLAVVTFGVPALLMLLVPRVGYERAVRTGGSVALAALAAFWFVERVMERSFFGGVLG
jgi:hypothetical protein